MSLSHTSMASEDWTQSSLSAVCLWETTLLFLAFALRYLLKEPQSVAIFGPHDREKKCIINTVYL